MYPYYTVEWNAFIDLCGFMMFVTLDSCSSGIETFVDLPLIKAAVAKSRAVLISVLLLNLPTRPCLKFQDSF